MHPKEASGAVGGWAVEDQCPYCDSDHEPSPPAEAQDPKLLDSKYTLALEPNCPECGSANVKRERPYRSRWLLLTCRDCGEESEVDAEIVNPATERY
jgi:hypothetical protein